MTQTSGLRHRHAPLNPRHSLNTLLRRQHHQSLRSSRHVTSRDRPLKLHVPNLDNTRLISHPG